MGPLPMGALPRFEAGVQRCWENPRNSLSKRRDALAIGLGLCGLRWCEVARSKLEWLDCCQALIRVKSAKGGISRSVPVGRSWLGTMLDVRCEYRRRRVCCRSKQLFHSAQGMPLRYNGVLKRLWSFTEKSFGQRYSFHCLRHTAAMRLYNATHDVVQVQRFLGHRSLQWTSVYLAGMQTFSEEGLPAFARGKPFGLRVWKPEPPHDPPFEKGRAG